jgi:membrane-associated phospholipid phosphatase
VIERTANFFSVAFHPLLVPTIIYAIIFGFAPPLARPLSDNALLYILAAIFITTFVIPICCIAVLRFSAYIPSFSMRNRKDRIVPFLFVSVFYAITTYMFYAKMQLNQVLVVIMLAITVVTFFLALVTVFWKISIHSAAITGMVGFLVAIMIKFPLADLLWPLVLSVVVAGLVMSARLYLNEHEPNEVFMGGLVGFVFCFGAVFLMG